MVYLENCLKNLVEIHKTKIKKKKKQTIKKTKLTLQTFYISDIFVLLSKEAEMQ